MNSMNPTGADRVAALTPADLPESRSTASVIYHALGDAARHEAKAALYFLRQTANGGGAVYSEDRSLMYAMEALRNLKDALAVRAKREPHLRGTALVDPEHYLRQAADTFDAKRTGSYAMLDRALELVGRRRPKRARATKYPLTPALSPASGGEGVGASAGAAGVV